MAVYVERQGWPAGIVEMHGRTSGHHEDMANSAASQRANNVIGKTDHDQDILYKTVVMGYAFSK